MSTPLLESDSCCARVARVDGREGECACHTIDAYLEIGRYGRPPLTAPASRLCTAHLPRCSLPTAAHDAGCRSGRHGRWPGPPTLLPLLLLGVSAYGLSSLLVLQPTFLDDQMRAEWFAGQDQTEATVALAAVSSGFFLLCGAGLTLTPPSSSPSPSPSP
jgi:hypothetical protein